MGNRSCVISDHSSYILGTILVRGDLHILDRNLINHTIILASASYILGAVSVYHDFLEDCILNGSVILTDQTHIISTQRFGAVTDGNIFKCDIFHGSRQ